MKTASQSMKFPTEIKGIPGLILTLTVSAERSMLPALNAAGVGEMELPNLIKARLEDARDACDGSVPGLIISNLEE